MSQREQFDKSHQRDQARREWHRQIGCKTWEACPTEKECRAFDAGFDAAISTPSSTAATTKCPDCDGSGWGHNTNVCKRCNGAGEVNTPSATTFTSLDTPERVCFYEQEFYVLSNFSSFRLRWKGWDFDTSEAAYHSEKFPKDRKLHYLIADAPSAHLAFKLAEQHKAERRPDWDEVKVGVMRDILRAKAAQHEYVRRKLLETGERELVENSWRDDFWGWGPNRDGKNMLGKLWMQVRSELRERNDISREGNP